MMKSLTAAALLALSLAPAHAAWTGAGDVLDSGTTLALTTAWLAPGDPDAPFNLSGMPALDVAGVESLAGVAPYALDRGDEAATEGSLAWQSFSVAAGDTLRFDWQFQTAETDFEDHAFVVLDGQLLTLATRSQPGAASQSFSHVFTDAGLATLAVGVVDTVDVLGVSTLTVANLQLTPIPEPATLLLWAAGLAGLGAAQRRRRTR